MFNTLISILIDVISGLGTAAVNLVVFWIPFAIIGMVALSIGKIWEKIKS